MKKTTAQTFIEVTCSCPYCEAYLDILHKGNVTEELSRQDEFSSENCDLEITCEECKNVFLVTDIFY